MDSKRSLAHDLPRRQRGLTLVELLVAISVLAVVAVLGWRGLDGIVRARVGLSENLDQARGMQLAFAQLQNDCAHIVGREIIPNRAPLVVDRGRLILVRYTFADNQPTRLQVIAYAVRDGVLTRRESLATRDLQELDGLWTAVSNDTDNSQPVVLQQGVAAMNMRLWASNSRAWQAPDVDAIQNTGTSPQTQQPAPPGSANQRQERPVITGLEVALQLQNSQDSMLKIFLLGAV